MNVQPHKIVSLIVSLRLTAVARLSLVLYDINSPHFQDGDLSWRKQIVKIVNIFFEQLWAGQAVRRLLGIADFPDSHLTAGRCATCR
jgi:hypothetical protein